MRRKNGWIKVLENKVKLVQKQYGIVAFRIFIAKINIDKTKKIKEKIVT